MMDKKSMMKMILSKIIGDGDKPEKPAEEMDDMDEKKPGVLRKVTIIAAGAPEGKETGDKAESLMDIMKKKKK